MAASASNNDSGTRQLLARVLLTVGLLAMIGLVAWQGFGTVAGLLASAGPAILLLTLFQLPFLGLRTIAWRLLFEPGRAPRFGAALRAMWIGQSVNTLLPVATIGGDVVKARLLHAPPSLPERAASLIVDKTLEVVTLLLLTLIGIGLLLTIGADGTIVTAAVAGFFLLALGCAGFVLAQLRGIAGSVTGLAAKILRNPYWTRLAPEADKVDRCVRELYRSHSRAVRACAAQVAAHLLLTGEIWCAAQMMGHPVSLLEATMLKTLGGALRGAAFVLPAGLGLLEGAFVVLGGLTGHSAASMLAISLATRVREVTAGLPALVAWHRAERRRLA